MASFMLPSNCFGGGGGGLSDPWCMYLAVASMFSKAKGKGIDRHRHRQKAQKKKGMNLIRNGRGKMTIHVYIYTYIRISSQFGIIRLRAWTRGFFFLFFLLVFFFLLYKVGNPGQDKKLGDLGGSCLSDVARAVAPPHVVQGRGEEELLCENNQLVRTGPRESACCHVVVCNTWLWFFFCLFFFSFWREGVRQCC